MVEQSVLTTVHNWITRNEDKVVNAIKKVDKSHGDLISKLKKTEKEYKKVDKVSKKYEKVVEQQSKKLDSLREKVKGLKNTVKDLKKVNKQSTDATKKFTDSLTIEQQALKYINRQLKYYNSLKAQGIPLTRSQSATVRALKKDFIELGGKLNRVGDITKNVLKSFTYFRWTLVNVAMAAAVAYGIFRVFIKPAVELETAMANVRKTTNFTREEIKELSTSLIKLSTWLPISAKELADIATVAGQLGIGSKGVKAVEQFTRTAAMMSIATEMTAEQAATSLAKITQAFGLPISQVNKLGSVINELSNTTAATSVDIATSLTRVGAAAANLGLSVDFISAIQSTLIGAGMQATRAGTRIRNAINMINSNMQKFADFMGVSLEKFRKDMEENAEKTILSVIERLRDYGSSTEIAGKSTELFARIGGFAIQTLIRSYDELTKNLRTANDEMENGLSLIKETIVRIETTESQWNLLVNQIKAGILAQDAWTNSIIKWMRVKLLSYKILRKEGIGRAMALYGVPLSDITLRFHLEGDISKLKDLYGEGEKLNTVLKLIREQTDDLNKETVAEMFIAQYKNEIVGSVEELENLNKKIDESNSRFSINAELIDRANKEIEETGKISIETASEIKIMSKETKDYLDLIKTPLGAENMFMELSNAIDKLKGKTLDINWIANNFKSVFTGGMTESDFEKSQIGAYFDYIDKQNEEIAQKNEKIREENLREFNIYYKKLEEYEKNLAKTPYSKGFKPYLTEPTYKRIEPIPSIEKELGGYTEQEWDTYLNTRSELNDEINKYNSLMGSARNKVNELRSELKESRGTLSDFKSQLSEVNKTIAELSKPIFTGQTDIKNLIRDAELYIKKQKLASFGIIDVQKFLQDSLAKSADGYDKLLESVEKVTKATTSSKDSYDAWRETVKEFIRNTVESGNILKMNVSGAVDKYSTLLLSTSKFTDEGKNQTTTVSLLRDAYDVHYGAMQNDVNDAVQAHKEAGSTIFDSAQQVIDALKTQWSEQSRLTDSVKLYELQVKDLQGSLNAAQKEFEAYRDELRITKQMLGEVAIAQDKVNRGMGGGGGGGGGGISPPKKRREGSINPVTDNPWGGHGMGDFIMRPNQQPVSFSKDDTIVGVKGGGLGGVTINEINISGVSGNPEEFAAQLAESLRNELRTL